MPDINMKNRKKRPDIAIGPFDLSGISSVLFPELIG